MKFILDDQMHSAPRFEELISFRDLIQDVSLFSEVTEDEFKLRISLNTRGDDISFKKKIHYCEIRGKIMMKEAVRQLIDSLNAPIGKELAYYFLYNGHAVEEGSLGKELHYYLLFLEETLENQILSGAAHWDEIPPSKILQGKFDVTRILHLHFKRDQIRKLLDECHVKHSITASRSSPFSVEEAEVVSETFFESENNPEVSSGAAKEFKENVQGQKKSRGRVASLEKEYLEAQKRAQDKKFDVGEVIAHLFEMAGEGGWTKLKVKNEMLYYLDGQVEKHFNRDVLRQWLNRRNPSRAKSQEVE